MVGTRVRVEQVFSRSNVEANTLIWVGASHQEIADCLIELQYGRCGYCEIGIGGRDRQVEHVVLQSHPEQGVERALGFTNLIACRKGEHKRQTTSHGGVIL